MIDRFRALEKKYANIHNHLDLVAIENLAIPITKIEIEVLGQQIDEVLPTTEFILRFTDIGINTVESLSEALGFDKLLVENLIALEESSGNVTYTASSSEITITPQGRETLRTKLAASPKVTTKSLVFDNTLWELAPWNLQEFTTKSALDRAKVEYNAVQKKSKNRVTQADLDVTLINRELARQSRNSKFEVHQLHRVISRKAGFKIAEIMVFYSEAGEKEFLVIVNDQRSVEHEQFIKKIGGIGNLGFEFENNSEPFSVFNIAQCIATAFFSLVQIWIEDQQGYIIYAIFIFLLGFGSVANTLRFKFREQDRKDMIVMNTGNDNKIRPTGDELTKDIELDD
jgi:hypothetical protein